MQIMDGLIERVNKYWENIYNTNNIVCFGAGQKGKQTITLLREKGIEPVALCDNNVDIQGRQIMDLPVLSYNSLKSLYNDYTIIITTTINYALKIKEALLLQGEKNPICFMANPFKAENKFLSVDNITSDLDEYIQCYNILEDQESKDIFIEFLYWKLTGDLSTILKYTENNDINEFFDENIISWRQGVYIDVGAYTGDSILRFISYSKGRYKHIYAIEPDESSFKDLQNFVQLGRVPNTTLIQKACWSKIEEKEWYSATDLGCSYESSNLYRNISTTISNSIENRTEKKAIISHIIKTETLDNLFYSKVTPELIKLDVLSSEIPILYGAKELIRQVKPNIIMEMGTYSDYLTESILFLYRINPKYKFILRQKDSFSNSRTALYVKN